MEEVLKTHLFHVKEGSYTSRVDRKRYWANRLKLLAAGYSDTAGDEEEATGHMASF